MLQHETGKERADLGSNDAKEAAIDKALTQRITWKQNQSGDNVLLNCKNYRIYHFAHYVKIYQSSPHEDTVTRHGPF